MANPMIHKSAPTWGVLTAFDKGAYKNQPNEAAPPGVMKLNMTVRPPRA